MSALVSAHPISNTSWAESEGHGGPEEEATLFLFPLSSPRQQGPCDQQAASIFHQQGRPRHGVRWRRTASQQPTRFGAPFLKESQTAKAAPFIDICCFKFIFNCTSGT